MANRSIYPDKTSMVFIYEEGNKFKKIELTYDNIISIRFEKIKEKKFIFVPFDSEQIVITSGKLGKPIVYTKKKNKAFFEDYKNDLRKFAKDNSVSFLEA